MQNKFSSGKPAGSRANFSLVTENQSQGATYAEGDLAYVTNIFGHGLSGTGTQYFSDKRYNPGCSGSGFCPTTYPFDLNQTSQLKVTVWRSVTTFNGRNLSVTLRSPPASGTYRNIIPLGCSGTNILYGEWSTPFLSGEWSTPFLSKVLVTIAVGAPQEPPPIPR